MQILFIVVISFKGAQGRPPQWKHCFLRPRWVSLIHSAVGSQLHCMFINCLIMISPPQNIFSKTSKSISLVVLGTSLLEWFPAKSCFKLRLAFTDPAAGGNTLFLADLQGYKFPPWNGLLSGPVSRAAGNRVITLWCCHSLSYQSIWLSSLNFKMEILC